MPDHSSPFSDLLLTVSRATVTRDWHVARAWLFRRMTQGVTEVPGE